jgi:DNA modification methylase
VIKAYGKDSKGLTEVADNSIQLCITSPPNYILNIGEPDEIKNLPLDFKQKMLLRDYGSFASLLHQLVSAASAALNIQFIQMLSAVERVLKPGGVLILNIGNLPVKSVNDLFLSELSIMYPYYMAEEAVRSGFRLRNEYIAINSVDDKPAHVERWFAFSKGEIKQNMDVEVPVPLVSHTKTVLCEKDGLEVVTPFSEDIVSLFIKKYSVENDWVLDPYVGAGTVAVAAAKLGRNATVYERNKAVWENALFFNLEKLIEYGGNIDIYFDSSVVKIKT